MRTPLPRELVPEYGPTSARGPAEQVVGLDRGFESIMGETWLVRSPAGLHVWSRESRMDPYREVPLAAADPVAVEGAGIQLSVRLREASGREHHLAVPLHVERGTVEALLESAGRAEGVSTPAPDVDDAEPAWRDPMSDEADDPPARRLVPVVRAPPGEVPDAPPPVRAPSQGPVVPVTRAAAERRAGPSQPASPRQATWVWLVLAICGLGCVFGGAGGEGVLPRLVIVVVAVLLVRKWFPSGAPGSEQSEGEEPPLHSAAFTGDIEALRELLEAEVDLERRNAEGETALHGAACDEPEALRLLLARGADVRARSAQGRTPLHVAAGWGATECVVALLDAGSHADARDAEGATPLHAAEGADDVIAALLAAGADVHARNARGETPLHRAAVGEDPAGVRRLLAAGADPEARDAEGLRPIDQADDADVRAAFGG